MAAPMKMTLTRLRFHRKLCFNLQLCSIASRKSQILSYSTIAEESKELDVDIDEEINKLRDVSNMSDFHKQKLKQGLTFNMEELRNTETYSRSYLRKMYAKYGKASGIDPSILWPSEEELDSLIDIDNNWTSSFDDLMTRVRERKEAEIASIQEREDNIEKAMERMPKLIQDFKEQQKKLGVAEQQSQVQQDDIRDEFIEYFGFEPINDSKFSEFKNYKKFEKAQQQKKLKKEKKRQGGKEESSNAE